VHAICWSRHTWYGWFEWRFLAVWFGNLQLSFFIGQVSRGSGNCVRAATLRIKRTRLDFYSDPCHLKMLIVPVGRPKVGSESWYPWNWSCCACRCCSRSYRCHSRRASSSGASPRSDLACASINCDCFSENCCSSSNDEACHRNNNLLTRKTHHEHKLPNHQQL
jgi:hypothetical protein